MRQCQREALREIKAYADTIRYATKEIPETVIINRRVYLYELNDTDPYKVIADIINKWYGTDTPEPRVRWFFELQVEQVIRQATVASAERINALAEVAGYAQPYQVQSILLSTPYRERIRRVASRVFEEMKGFTGDTANRLARTLSEEMAAGRGIAQVKRRLAAEFDISMSRAETIARTELAKSHRDTRRDQAKDARDRLELDARVQLISALAPTTRPSHAALHLRIVQVEEVEPLYRATPGQRINCICSEQTVLVTKDGEIIGQRKATERDAKLAKYLAETPVNAR